jgi:hypothetical protein
LFGEAGLPKRRTPETINEKQRAEGAKRNNPFGYNRILLFLKNLETAISQINKLLRP